MKITTLDLPVGHRKMNVKRKASKIQDTRYEKGKTIEGWLCEAFPRSTDPWVFVKTIEQARKLAAECGFDDGILL